MYVSFPDTVPLCCFFSFRLFTFCPGWSRSLRAWCGYLCCTGTVYSVYCSSKCVGTGSTLGLNPHCKCTFLLGQEGVGHSFDYVALLWFLKDVCTLYRKLEKKYSQKWNCAASFPISTVMDLEAFIYSLDRPANAIQQTRGTDRGCAAHIGMDGIRIEKEPRQRDEYVYRIS
jgi:hypothetical protein